MDREEPLLSTRRLAPMDQTLNEKARVLPGHNPDFLYSEMTYDIQMEARQSRGARSYDTNELIQRIDHFPMNEFKEMIPGNEGKMSHYRNKYDDRATSPARDLLIVDLANSTDDYAAKESSLFKTSVGIVQGAEGSKKEFSHFKAPRTAVEIRSEMKARILLNVVGAEVDVTTKEYTRFKNLNFHNWGDFLDLFEHIQIVLAKNCLSSVKLIGSQLIKLSTLMRTPTTEEVFNCLDNKKIVLRYKNQSNGRFQTQ